MGYYHNTSDRALFNKVRLSGTSYPNQSHYDIAGRKMNTEIVPDKVRANFYHIYWTPHEPIPPGQMFYYGWSSDNARDLPKASSPGQYKLTMQNHFGNRVIETFFLVVPEGTKLISKTEDFTKKEAVAGFHIYYWSKELPPRTTHRIDIVISPSRSSQTSTAVSGRAKAVLLVLKGMWAAIVTAIENNDPDTALTLVDELIVKSKEEFEPEVKGTPAESAVKAGIDILAPLRDALEKKQMDQVKRILDTLNQIGPEIEEALERQP